MTPAASAASTLSKTIFFATFNVTSQVFYYTPLTYALVNLKPLLPGHVLVCPRRAVPRIHDLTSDEVTDLFLSVQKIGKAIEKIYGADGLNIAVQDGIAAGQSVPHVHTHIIPRKTKDLPEDEIYKMMESDDADLGKLHKEVLRREGEEKKDTVDGETNGTAEERSKFPAVGPDVARKPRTEEEMRREAVWLRARMEEID